MIKFDKVTKKYGEQLIFENLSLSFPEKGLVCIVGPSGCGKSTILNLISGLDLKYEGIITINNKNLKLKKEQERDFFRAKNIGYVFQNYNLLNLDNLFNNVLLPYETINNSSKFSKKRRVEDVLSFVGLGHKIHSQVNKLSGGEKQRAAIARAIINEPEILLCDEPTGALDEQNSLQIFSLLKKLSNNHLVVVVTHDLNLAKQFSDEIISFKTKKTKQNKKKSNVVEEKLVFYEAKSYFKKPKLSLSFIFSHIKTILNAKKFRTLLTNFIASFSLACLGFTFLLFSSISNEIKKSFSSVINDSQLLVSLKNKNQPLYTNVYSANLNEIEELKVTFHDEIKDYGVTYNINFEEFFIDANDVIFQTEFYSMPLNKFSARTFNDYVWNDEVNDETISNISFMENDQIILGLPYQTMANLCFYLKIDRGYETLKNYIRDKTSFILFSVLNENWEYDDEEIFRLIDVYESKEPTIVHTSHLFNEWLFETKMRLPSTLEIQSIDRPWIMEKIYYLKGYQKDKLYEEMVFSEKCENFILENSYNYYPQSKIDDRLLVFTADRFGMNINDIELMKRFDQNIESYIITNDGGYSIYQSNLIAGFSKKLFLSKSLKDIEEIIDYETSSSSDQNLILPENIQYGDILHSPSGCLNFEIENSPPSSGRKSETIYELEISSSLASSLSIGLEETIYLTMSQGEDSVVRVAKVVGIHDSTKNLILGNTLWTTSFFFNMFNVSGFSLLPRCVILNLNNGSQSENTIQNLSNIFKKYEISNPNQEINQSVDSTMMFIETILISFSCLGAITAIILLIITIYLSVVESKNEIKIFRYLGITKSEIKRVFVWYSLIIGFSSSLFASAQIFIVSLFMPSIISGQLGSVSNFSFDPVPYLIIFVISLFLSYIIGKIVSSSLLTKDIVLQ